MAGGEEEREHSVTLPPASYQALSGQRLEICSRVLAHIIWDDDQSRLVLLGWVEQTEIFLCIEKLFYRNEESVGQTAVVLSQYLNLMPSGPRKLIGRSSHAPSQLTDEAKNLLLMSALPPELTISSHSPLGRTVSDIPNTQAATRRKLESEDSSYDSDHENINSSTNVRPPLSNSMSKSHDDVSRTYSETLAQVIVRLCSDHSRIKNIISGILRLRFYKAILPIRSFTFQFELTIRKEMFAG